MSRFQPLTIWVKTALDRGNWAGEEESDCGTFWSRATSSLAVTMSAEKEQQVTEPEWVTCADPHAMLDLLDCKASVRKLRLLVCGCCRRQWENLSAAARRSVEVAELFADRKVRAATLPRSP